MFMHMCVSMSSQGQSRAEQAGTESGTGGKGRINSIRDRRRGTYQGETNRVRWKAWERSEKGLSLFVREGLLSSNPAHLCLLK